MTEVVAAHLTKFFLPPHPADDAAGKSWDDLRYNVIEMMIETYLLPSLEEELRRDLKRSARDAVIEEMADSFSKRLAIGPYRPPPQNPLEGVKERLLECHEGQRRFTVGVIYQAAKNDAISMAYLDADGVVRAQAVLPEKAFGMKKEKLKVLNRTL